MKKNDIVRLINNKDISADIGAIAIVLKNKSRWSGYIEVVWISKSSNGQMDGDYNPSDFEKIGECSGHLLLGGIIFDK